MNDPNHAPLPAGEPSPSHPERQSFHGLPTGVRWAVRLLKAGSTLIGILMLLLVPFLLLPGLVQFGATWWLELLLLGFCIPFTVGQAMRVMAICIERGHDHKEEEFDPVVEWVGFAVIHLVALCFGLFYGIVASTCELLTGWNENPSSVSTCAAQLLTRVVVIGLLALAVACLRKVARRRKGVR